ncbi:hypothetical protein [Leptolyngbya sp. FACHB-261]|uniref:hypothetical protein n=1 Tax=Leptolyngbya sp. FACHB-261 TaxID=2692806 RepID=UPI00168710D8|nr:hypothetical protein [Leptolyngbya sp. FACHB-261]MBD2103979.1 hypothetical protein [Leptolyngbya sp. FACHB-261]
MSVANLTARIEQARDKLQASKSLLSEIQRLEREPPVSSDYEREIVRGGRSKYTLEEAAEYTTNGPNDEVMVPKNNLISNAINGTVNGVMSLIGYDTTLRPPTEDNDFYRDYAQYMPGYNIDGIPSGAWAQNSATNYVGHGTEPGNPWYNIRTSLVSQEKALIDSRLAAGGSGRLSFDDLYQVHVNAYDNAQGGGNGFIDPAHFAIAVYGVPSLETIGINTGPITGASIDIFNNPEDSVTEGWAKRMALAGAEITVGTLMSMNPVGIVVGQPITALGVYGAFENTRSAIDRGMLNDWF